MKKEYRLKKNQDIENVLKNKIYRANQYYSIYIKTNNETSHIRYAISAGKKLGNAVKRNKIKRLINAVLKDLNIKLNNNIDIFIIVRDKAKDLTYNEIYKEIKYLFGKLNLLNQGENK